MDPLVWLVVLAVCALVGAGAVKVRSREGLQVVWEWVRGAADRAVPLDRERGLDRVVDEVQRSVGSQMRRGMEPRAITVLLGSVIFQTVAIDGDIGPVRTAVLGGLLDMSPPIASEEAVSITVKRGADLDPTKVVVAVSSRGASPTPRPVRSGAAGGHAPSVGLVARKRVMKLKPLTAGMPEFVVASGRELTVGRENCDLVLPAGSGESHGTSRVHAVLHADVAAGSVQVRDNESINHTYVNGKQVTTATLRNLDTIRLGKAEWLMTIEGDK